MDIGTCTEIVIWPPPKTLYRIHVFRDYQKDLTAARIRALGRQARQPHSCSRRGVRTGAPQNAITAVRDPAFFGSVFLWELSLNGYCMCRCIMVQITISVPS